MRCAVRSSGCSSGRYSGTCGAGRARRAWRTGGAERRRSSSGSGSPQRERTYACAGARRPFREETRSFQGHRDALARFDRDRVADTATASGRVGGSSALCVGKSGDGLSDGHCCGSDRITGVPSPVRRALHSSYRPEGDGDFADEASRAKGFVGEAIRHGFTGSTGCRYFRQPVLPRTESV